MIPADYRVDIYPVGLLHDLRRFRGALRHQPRPWNRRGPQGHPWWRLWHDLRGGTIDRARRREWRALRNYFNGFLAEPTPFPEGLRRCGSGWTRRRALASLHRHMNASVAMTIFPDHQEPPMTTFDPGDRVKVTYRADDGHDAWYRATAICPSTQRAGDWEVEVTEVGPHSNVTVGSRRSPILGAGVDMVADN